VFIKEKRMMKRGFIKNRYFIDKNIQKKAKLSWKNDKYVL